MCEVQLGTTVQLDWDSQHRWVW